MTLEVYTSNSPPAQARTAVIRPRLVGWTARVWRESPARAIPLVKLDVQLEARDVPANAVADALEPFAPSLRQNFVVYLQHSEEVQAVAPWAVGLMRVKRDRAFVFLHNFLAAANGELMLQLLQSASAHSDLAMSIIAHSISADELVFAVCDYDLGIHNRIG